MSLSSLMNGVVEYVADALVNDVGRPVPDRILRYHGALPHDCCTDNGFLAVHWDGGRAVTGGTASSASDKNDPCVQKPMVTLVVRYVVCWPEPPLDAEGLPYIDTTYDVTVNEKAGMLADVEDGIVRALVGLGCALNSQTTGDPAIVETIRRTSAGRSLRFADAAPILPSGKCAGVLWRLHVAPLPGPAS